MAESKNPDQILPLKVKFGCGIFLLLIFSMALHALYLNFLTPPRQITWIHCPEVILEGEKSHVIIAVQNPQGRGIEGTKISLSPLDSKKVIYSENLPSLGALKIPLPLPDYSEVGRVYKFNVHINSPHHSIEKEISYQISQRARIELVTDRPFYEPGERIRVKISVQSPRSLKPLPEREIGLELRNPQGYILARKEAYSSDWGQVDFDFHLHGEAPSGEYQLVVKTGREGWKKAIEVRSQQRPPFHLEARFSQSHYYPSQQIQLDLTGSYFTGQPLKKATGRILFYHSSSAELYYGQKVKFDDEGKASLSLEASQLVGDEKKAAYRVAMEVRNGGGQEISMEKNITLGKRKIFAYILPERIRPSSLKGLAKEPLFFYTCYKDGSPAQTEIQWQYDTFSTNEQGLARKKLPLDYRYRDSFFIVRDKWGNKNRYPLSSMSSVFQDSSVEAFYSQFYWSRPSFRYGYYGNQGLPFKWNLNLPRVTYRRGQKVKLRIKSLFPNPSEKEPVSYRVCLYRSFDFVDSFPLQSQGGGRYTFSLPPSLEGLVLIKVEGISSYRTPPAFRYIWVQPSPSLTLKASTSQRVYRPGEGGSLSVKVQSEKGSSLPAALSLWAVDRAWSNQEKSPLPSRTLKMAHRALGPSKISPLPPGTRRAFTSSAWKGELGRRLALTRLLWSHSPEIYRLARSKNLYQEKMSKFREKKKFHESLQRAFQFFILAGFFLYMIISIVGGIADLIFQSREGCLGGCSCLTLLFLPFIALLISSITSSRNRMVERRPPSPPSQPLKLKLSSTLVEDSPGPPLRKFFPKTLFWMPEVITTEGQATIDFPPSHSITTYQVHLQALTREGEYGTLSFPLRYFQPFFLRFEPPRQLQEGDKVTLKAVLFNYLKEKQTVEVQIKGGSALEVKGETSKVLTLKANEVRPLHFQVTAGKHGSSPVTITARGKKASDSLVKLISILPPGEKITSGISKISEKEPAVHKLNLPSTRVPQTARLEVKFYPKVTSQLAHGVEGLLRRPHG